VGFFQAQPPGYRQTAIFWVVSAKRRKRVRGWPLIEDSAHLAASDYSAAGEADRLESTCAALYTRYSTAYVGAGELFMSVPHALLALLTEGPKYGLRLQNEFEARTGEVWPLNVGQVYTTLQRLERDGLVETDDGER
jgi:hypothetical protein